MLQPHKQHLGDLSHLEKIAEASICLAVWSIYEEKSHQKEDGYLTTLLYHLRVFFYFNPMMDGSYFCEVSSIRRVGSRIVLFFFSSSCYDVLRGLSRGKMGPSLWLNDGHFLLKKDGESSVKLWQGGLSSKAIVETCLGWFKGELARFGNDIFEVSLKKSLHENYIKCLKKKATSSTQ